MRKIIVLEHISMNGVIQAGGGPDEDPSGGFVYGGWVAPFSDEILDTVLRRQMYQVTLGSGKRLFADGTIPAAFKVTEGIVTPCGAVVVNYERAHLPLRAAQGGAITTGRL